MNTANAFMDATGSLSLTAIILLAWSLPWKGYALWLAARNKQKWWFIALLFISTVGLLDIYYIYFGSKTTYIDKTDDL